ncbi:uncharacterized protein LOC142354113 [Convolutriloba macropyga]|uniref:uncharacterized protein LOC142354113 n=1 Tax=Convolutriloba macropyga TaxID=536237 RepID=UPI003F52628F
MAYLPPFLYGYGYDGYGSGYESGNNDNGSSGLFDNDGPSTTDKLYILTRDKVLIDSIQLPISVITILINLYCLLTIGMSPEIRNKNYFLVSLQSFMDLVFSGIISLVYYSLEILNAINKFCQHVVW